MTRIASGLVAPILFLKDVVGLAGDHPITAALNGWVYAGWLLLTMSILGAIVYYYSSAKWVKLAWSQPADMFGIRVHDGFVETALDISYFAMMTGFVLGIASILAYMATYTSIAFTE